MKKGIEIDGYVLRCIVVTRDTDHFEISLLNADAPKNAVQIIQKQYVIQKGKKETRTNTKEEENWKQY